MLKNAIFLLVVLVSYHLLRVYFIDGETAKYVNMDGKTVIITGASSGIGLEATKGLLKMGAKVIMACRNETKTRRVIKKELFDTKNVEFISLELEDLDSVVGFVNTIKEKVAKSELNIHALLLNAGIYSDLAYGGVTKQGFELAIGVNHIGHFLLIKGLLPELQKSKARVVLTSSLAHWTFSGEFDLSKRLRFPFESTHLFATFNQYAFTKLTILAFSQYLHNKYSGEGKMTVNALNPGAVYTAFTRNLPKWFATYLANPFMYFFLRTKTQGAQNAIYLASSPEVEGVSGKYYSWTTQSSFSNTAKDEKIQEHIWEVSNKAVEPYFDKIKN